MKPAICAAVLLFSGFVLAQDAIRVPAGKPVLIDGKISAGEWDDAATKVLPNGFGKLYFKRSGEFVYIAVQLANQNQLSTVDIYIDGGMGDVHGLYDLHASAKLGERAYYDGWPDWSKWWNNDRWTANWARIDTFDPRKFLPEPNHEFQIARSRFPRNQWDVMFEIMSNVRTGGGDTQVFPVGAKNTDPGNWYRIRFD